MVTQPTRKDFTILYNPVKITGTLQKENLETMGVVQANIQTIMYSTERFQPVINEREAYFSGGKGQSVFTFDFKLKVSEHD